MKPEYNIPEVNLDDYCICFGADTAVDALNTIPTQDILDDIKSTGIIFDQVNREATFIVKDSQPHYLLNDSDDYDFLPIAKAMQLFPDIKEKYYYRAISKTHNEYVKKCSEQAREMGYFLRVKAGRKVKLPCQAAMYMSQAKTAQYVHNIIVLEEGAELTMITGCSTKKGVDDALHISVEEHYIEKNARLISNMIHVWGRNAVIFPNTASVVGENAHYESNYIVLKPAKYIVTNPSVYLNGRGAKYKSLTVAVCHDGCILDAGGFAYLNAADSGAELIQRGVCTGGSLHQNGLLIGRAPCRAHVDCAGMILAEDDKGYIESIPGLKSYHQDARMSHEASIGKISPEQLEYLMSRGLEEQEALSLMIRGFLGYEIEGLGQALDDEIAEIVALAGHGEA